MTQSRVPLRTVVKNQLPLYVIDEFPLIGDFLSTYYLSQDFQGGPLDLIQNIDRYVKLDNNANTISSTILLNDITAIDNTIIVSNTKGFPDEYGLIRIDDEIITYSGKTDISFTGCTRGFDGIADDKNQNLVFTQTLAEDHVADATVENLSVLFLKEFLKKTKNQLLPGLEDRSLYADLDKSLFIKQAKDFYSSKGTSQSFKVLFKALYGVDVEVLKPSEHLISPSAPLYKITNDMVVEPISGDVQSIRGYTLIQDSYGTTIDKAYAPITNVEKVFVSGASTDFYRLSIDSTFSSDKTYGGAEYGTFSVHPKTKCIGDYTTSSTTLDVDSTVGFPTSGELYVTYTDRKAGIVSYTSKAFNQFYGCSGITDNIANNTVIGINTHAVATLADDTQVKVRITSVLGDLKYDQPNYYYEKDDTIEIKTLGISTADVASNSWIFNAATSYKVETITKINETAFRYRVILDNDHIFKVGDTLTVTTTGYSGQSKVYGVNGVKSITIGDQGSLDEYITDTITITIKKNILKANATNFPSANNVTTDVSSVYKDNGKDTLVASSSIPFYKDQRLNVKKNLITFDGTFTGDTFKVLTSGDHGFYTGDTVYYTPQKVTSTVEDADGNETIQTTTLTGITQEGIYFVKRLSDTTSLKLARSRSELYTEDYVTTEAIDVTDNTIEFWKFKGQELENHKLLREISDPEDEGGLVETKAGQASGILINGVEILNYKSVDSIFYGRIESIDVDGGGSGYNVISPPDFNIADPAGIGATGNVAVRGTFNEIRVVDTGFDYIGQPTIKISGGNGKDATADVITRLVDHDVNFNSEEGFGLVNLTTNTIGFNTYHKFRDYEKVIYKPNGQVPITGLSTGAAYYVDVQNATSVKLYKSKDEAVNQINVIDLTGYGEGRHTLASETKKAVVSSIQITNEGSGYENKKTAVVGLTTSLDKITVERHGYNSGELVTYSTAGTTIGGLTDGSNYYLTKIDDNTFKLSEIGPSGKEKFYYDTRQYINLTSTGSALDTHYFNYPAISVELIGRVGISSIGSETFKATLQPIVTGEIVSVNLSSKGSAYGSSEILNLYKEPEISLDIGDSVQVTPVIANGTVIEVLVDKKGSNITAPPLIEIEGGIGLVMTPVIENREVTKINVIEGGSTFFGGQTSTRITYPGSGAVFRANLQRWTVNQFEKNYGFITDDDGFIDDGLNDDYGLQYVHLYAPRKLREILYATDQSGNSLYNSPDLIIDNGSEKESTKHSPIIGWAYDGNPIYGPYGYSKVDGGVITQMLSGYQFGNPENRPSINTYKSGFFVEDYVHIPSSSESVLDENNGRFCVTPEFPKGTYAYFATIDSALPDSSGVFVNFKRPIFPYLIGDKFHSKPNKFNFTKNSNQDEYDIQNSQWLRNTHVYNFLSPTKSYEYLDLPYKMKKTQISDVAFATPGRIDSVGIITGGTNYKVDDNVIINNEGTGGFGADIKVSKVGGKAVTSISCATTSINLIEVVPTKKSGQYAFYAPTPHNFKNAEIISIAGLSTTAAKLSGDYSIGITTSVHVLTAGVGTTGATGIVTYFSIYGDLNSDLIKPNNVLTVGIGTTAEKVKVLNIDKVSNRLRVLRAVEGTTAVAQTATSILYEDQRKFTTTVGYKTSFNFQLNRELYFNPVDTLGIGTLSGVGVGYTITFTNPGAGITNKFVPTQTLYLPEHELRTNDELIYNLNDGTAIGVSTNGSAPLTLSDQQKLYVAKVNDNLIGLSTVRVGMASTGVFAGIGSTAASLGLLYFTSVGTGDNHSLKTNYGNVITVSAYKNTVTVTTAETHSLGVSDNVYIDAKPSISVIKTVSYNDENRRIVIDKRTIAASDINVTTNEVTVSDHRFELGQKLIYNSGTPSGGLTNEKFYYAVIVNKDTIKLSESYYDATSAVPTIVDITSATGGFLSPVNPPIKLYKDAPVVFNLSDSSLVYTKNAIQYPAFTFEFFEDEDQERIFDKTEESSTFEVIKSGTIGVDGQVTLVVDSTLPKQLYYNLVPISTDQLPIEKLQISIDDEVKANNEIEIVDSVYSGKQTISIGATNTFTYFISEVPESSSYTQSNANIKYSTDSSSGIGSIVDLKIYNRGNNYYKLPQVTGAAKKTTINDPTVGIGSNAVLTIQSDSIGIIKRTKLKDVGFDYPSDNTLRPTAKLAEIIKIDNLAIFESIGITSAGRGYGPTPKIIVFDGQSGEQMIEVDLLFEKGARNLKVLKNTYGINDVEPRLLPINNSNGVGIQTIGFNTTTQDATITLSTGFSTVTSFPFSIGDEIMIENVSVGIASTAANGDVVTVDTGRGYNTNLYNYQLFTVTGVEENYGGVGFVTFSMSNFLGSGEIPGTFNAQRSSGRIIAKKDFPIFDPVLTTTHFLKGEGVISLDDNTVTGTVERWDSDTGYLKVQTNKDFVVGHVIEGTSSKTRGRVSGTKSFTATYDLEAKSKVESGWEEKTGFLNLNSQVIQDGDYYQKFSYALKSTIDMAKWDDVVSALNHTAGFKKFSNLQVESIATNDAVVGVGSTLSTLDLVADLYDVVDTNCVYNFDLATENNKNNTLSDQVVLQSQILTDYSESIGNRVLSIDDFSSEFNSNPRATRYSNIARFTNLDANAHKYITYVQDRRYTYERQMMILTLLHDDAGFGYMNQYARLDTVSDLGSFDYGLDGLDGVIQFLPTKYQVNDYNVFTLSYNINDLVLGTGTSDFGGVRIATASTAVATGVGTGSTTRFVSIANTYTSGKVLFEFKTTSGDYEFNELTFVHDGTTVDLQEYGRLTNLNELDDAASGLGTYHPYISGSNVVIDFIPNVSTAASINAITVGMGNTAGIGSFAFNHALVGSEYWNIAASGSPTAHSVGEYPDRYDGAYIIAQATDTTNNVTVISEIMLCDTGTDVHMTEWGDLRVGATGSFVGVGTFGATYNSTTGLTALKFTPNASIDVEVRTFYNYMRFEDDIGAAENPITLDFTNAWMDSQYGAYQGTEVDVKRAFNLTHETYQIFERYFDGSDGTVIGTQGENPVLTDLVLYLDGQTITGITTWSDSSTEGNNAALTNIYGWQNGDDGETLAYIFENGSYGNITDSTDWDFSGDFSLEVWAKMTAAPVGYSTASALISSWDTAGSSDNKFILGVNSDYEVVLQLNGEANTFTNAPANIQLDKWHHIVVSRIGTELDMYLDGSKGGVTATYADAIAPTLDIRVGNYVGLSTVSFNGQIGVVRAYKGKGLDLSEVERNFVTQRGRFYPEFATAIPDVPFSVDIPNHFFVTGEELTYSNPGAGTTQNIGIVTATVPSIGSTDKLPSSVFVVKVDSNRIKLASTAENALKVIPEILEINKVGIGTTHTFTAKNQNEKIIVALDNYLQSPIVGTSVTTSLTQAALDTEDIVHLVGITSISGNDLIKIGDEVMKVQAVGVGTYTEALRVQRPWLGTVAVGHDTGAQVQKISGNYNVVNNFLNFVEAPYGGIPESSPTNAPYDRDWVGITTSSVFQGRSFMRSGTPGGSNETYSKNYLFDDISDDFNGLETTFTLKQDSANITGIENENAVILVNDIFQIPGIANDYTMNEQAGITSAIFSDSYGQAVLGADVNKSNLPIGGVIVTVGSSEGSAYQPLIGAGATITVGSGGTISAITIGSTGSGYRADYNYEILTDVTTAIPASSNIITLDNKNSVFGKLQLLGYGSTCTIGIGTYIKPTNITSIGTTSITIGVSSASAYEIAAGTAVLIKIIAPQVGVANIGIVTGTDPSNDNVITHIGFTTVKDGFVSTACSITNTDTGFSTTKTYEAVVDSPLSYSSVPLIYQTDGVSTPVGVGTEGKVDIFVSATTKVSDFTLVNTGYGYKPNENLTVPTGGITGIPTDATASKLERFTLTLEKTFTDKFAGWAIGQLQPLDDISDQFDGTTTDFQLRVNSVVTSIKASKGSSINIQDVLLVFYNNILQVPGEGYTFPGGSTIIFGEAPKSGDKVSIIFYKGSGGLDVVDVDVLETVKAGDTLQLNNDPSQGQKEVLQEDSRIAMSIDSTDVVSTNPYFGPGNVNNINLKRPMNWCRQTEDMILNGKRVAKDRALYEASIYPNTNVIQTVGVGSTTIYVESVRPLFNAQNENDISLSFQKEIVLVSQDRRVAASATATVSAGNTISAVTLTDGGVGYSTNPVVILGNPVGVGTTNRATARAYISNAGIVTGITMTGPGTGYTSVPQVLMTPPPVLDERVSSGVEYSGDFGLIVGVGTTAVTGIASTALIFELLIPENSIMRDTVITGTAVTISGISTNDYFVYRESNIGNPVTSLDASGTVVGVGTTSLDNVYKALKAETVKEFVYGVGDVFLRKITVGVTTYNGYVFGKTDTFDSMVQTFDSTTTSFDNFVFRNYYGVYSWGRIDCDARTATQEFPFYNQNGVTGISTSAYVRRNVPLKYRDYLA